MSVSPEAPNRDAGTARLAVVVPVALISFFYAGILEYSLPLYFSALADVATAAGGQFPAGIWSTLVKYQVTPWIVGPILAGLLSRRYGERLIWCWALLGKALVPLTLAMWPQPGVIKLLALWQGFTGALMWIAGVSLVQMVRPERKGLSNGLLMASLGVGSMLGPLAGRGVLYQREIGGHVAAGEWSACALKWFSFESATTVPQVSDFIPIFWILAFTTLFSGLLVGLWGQRPGQFAHDEQAPDWNRTLHDLGRLSRNSRFWALVITLCVLGGPVFQASNQFLPFRAEDLGLKSGAADFGWVWLQLLKTLMWIPGGLAVGLLAGRRAPGLAGVAMLGAFSLAGFGIGFSSVAWQLFAVVALFEFVRQFMRWSHAGYLSEHMPSDLRATAIGCSITLAGLGSTVFGWGADYMWNADVPGFESSTPFYAAAVSGLIGCVALWFFDRAVPIREAECEAD